jgi:tetratricopeptide (TPR) repeat protein
MFIEDAADLPELLIPKPAIPLAQTLIERALTLDPNSAWAWNRRGWLNVYIREPDRAIQHFQRAMRLSPIDGAGALHVLRRRC